MALLLPRFSFKLPPLPSNFRPRDPLSSTVWQLNCFEDVGTDTQSGELWSEEEEGRRGEETELTPRAFELSFFFFDAWPEDLPTKERG